MERLTFVKCPRHWNTGRHPTPYSSRKTFQEVVDRLAYYEDMEEQGRLVVLPCKVGDTVYVVKFATHEETEDGDLMPIAGGGKRVIWPVRVSITNYCDYLTQNARGYAIGSTKNGSGVTFEFDDIGKTVFLTREEAEQALKGGAE